ncbi:hypothetical protein [Nocardioides dongkuii]|uniref:hypothetical protein n=1 Tax=Nocardioides dongkuii TaxID=2760089 RepID=UPI0015FC02BE|nr:hypothetical protein [Nocardioides dongkuii]
MKHRAVRLVRALAVGTLLAVLVVLCLTGAGAPRRTEGGRSITADAYQQVVAQLLDRHRCSPRWPGGTDGRPASALIRTERGRLVVVPVDRGWAVYRGVRPGTLMAVCLDRPSALRADVGRSVSG